MKRLLKILLNPYSFIGGKRVSVMLQMSATECGAACLAMILNFYGFETTVSSCREKIGVGRDGIPAITLVHTARQFGLQARAFSTDLEQLSQIQLPAILFWEFNHYVVLEKWDGSNATIVDPTTGRITISSDELSRKFTGVILTFSRGDDFKPHKNVEQPAWRRYISFVTENRKAKNLLKQVFFVALLLQITVLSIPLFTKFIVDHVIPFGLINVYTWIGYSVLLSAFMHMLTMLVRSLLLIHVQAHLDAQLTQNFFGHMMTLPFKFFQERSTGDLLTRLNSNFTVRELLTNQTLTAIVDSMLVLFYLIVLLIVKPIYGLVVGGLGLLQILLIILTSQSVHQLSKRELVAQAESQGFLIQAIRGIATLKATGAETETLNQWSNLFYHQLNVSVKRNQITAVVTTIISTIRVLSPVFLLWWGVRYVLAGTMTLGSLLALNAIAISFLAPLYSLVLTAQNLQIVAAHLERVMDIFDATSEFQDSFQGELANLNGEIELRDVSFRYTERSPWILKNLSIKIAAGQKVAIVGQTGVGKSTLAMLLLGFYEPECGQVLFDRNNRDIYDMRSIRQRFGVVLQDSFVFAGTIRNTIAAGLDDVAFERVVKAAQVAEIHEEIIRMPMGYETFIAENGSSLSGGQKQRIAIARALVKKPSIILLDEATSNLDQLTESRIQNNLDEMNCTQIVIAHRLSTIRNADLILVLKDGVVVEMGTHDQLMAIQDTYYSLVNISYQQLETEYQL